MKSVDDDDDDDDERRGLWQNGKKIGPDFYTIPYERSFSLVLWVMVGEIFGQPALVGAKSPILNRYSLVAPQP